MTQSNNENNLQPLEVDKLEESLRTMVNDYSNIPEGLKHLFRGYLDYAEMVVLDRAVPALDGLRVSQRRSLWTIYEHFMKKNPKGMYGSDTVAGKVKEIHPHNTDVIYETFANFVRDREYCNVPLLTGEGSFGRRNVRRSLSASRYTSIRAEKALEEFFREIDGGVDFKYTEDGKYTEPSVLPVTFPFGLTMSIAGVGVGTGSNYFSFNLGDIADATIEVAKNGFTEKILVPDFPTGGLVHYDEKAFTKIMKTGRGTISLASEYSIEGKVIYFHNFHYFFEIKKFIEEVEELEMEEIAKVENLTSTEVLAAITVKDVAYINYVLKRILRDTSVASTASCHHMTLIDNRLRLVGVHEYLQEWVKWRANIIRTYYSKVLQVVDYNIKRLTIVIAFTRNRELVKKFIDTLYESKVEAEKILRDTFEDIDDDIIKSIMGMSISSLAEKGSREKRLESLKQEKLAVTNIIENPHTLLIQQVSEVKAKYNHERRTKIVEGDLGIFKGGSLDGDDTVEKEEVVPVKVVVTGGFLKKYHESVLVPKEEEHLAVDAMSDDYISCVDTVGRLIRMPLSSVGFVNPNAKNKLQSSYRGEYVPAYANLTSKEAEEIIFYDVMKPDVETVFLYRDGFISSLKYDEWLNAKYITKLTNEGISPLAYLIMNTIDPSKEFTVGYTSLGRVVVFDNGFKRPSRTARRKVANLNKNKNEQITHSVSVDDVVLLELFHNAAISDITTILGKPVEADGFLNFEKFNALLTGQ